MRWCTAQRSVTRRPKPALRAAFPCLCCLQPLPSRGCLYYYTRVFQPHSPLRCTQVPCHSAAALPAAFPRLQVLLLEGDMAPEAAGIPQALAALPQLVDVTLPPNAMDSDVVATSRAAPRLRRLNLAGSRVTDAGVAQALATLPDLRYLSLARTAVTGAGFQQVTAKASRLEWLDLSATQVSAEGLRHVAQLPALQELALDKCPGAATLAGLAHVAPLPLTRLGLRNSAFEMGHFVETVEALTSGPPGTRLAASLALCGALALHDDDDDDDDDDDHDDDDDDDLAPAIYLLRASCVSQAPVVLPAIVALLQRGSDAAKALAAGALARLWSGGEDEALLGFGALPAVLDLLRSDVRYSCTAQ